MRRFLSPDIRTRFFEDIHQAGRRTNPTLNRETQAMRLSII